MIKSTKALQEKLTKSGVAYKSKDAYLSTKTTLTTKDIQRIIDTYDIY